MNLFELEAVLRLNTSEYEKGIEDAEKSGTGFIDRIANTWTKAKSKFQTVTTILKPVTDLVEDVVDKYSNYQQLIGGVEKLFESSAKTVATNARNAFRTAGMSMNDYMEMAVSMSASLVQSLAGDTEAAADLVDIAIQDMGDNVNTFGRSMEDVQNAYRGLARGNYTMLDNLSLGYQGSAQEMYRLMQDAAALNEEFANSAVFGLDEKGHLNASYADMIRAIHIIQENMGVTGTTQREAAGTVSGSNASMKAALENLKTLMGDPKATQEEIEQATKDFTVTLESWLKNITPIITTAVKALFNVIGSLLDNLFKELGVETDFKGFFKAIADAVMNLLPIIAEGVKFLAEKAGHVFEFGSKVGQVFQAAFGIDPGGNADPYKDDVFGKDSTLPAPAGWQDVAATIGGTPLLSEIFKKMGLSTTRSNIDGLDDFYLPMGDTQETWYNVYDLMRKRYGRNLSSLEMERLAMSGYAWPDAMRNTDLSQGENLENIAIDGNNVTFDGASFTIDWSAIDEIISPATATVDTNSATVNADNVSLPFVTAGAGSYTFDENGNLVPGHAKGLWDVPYDDYYARLHRGEMVLTASEARDYREGNGGSSDAIVAAIQGMRNDLQHLQLVVGQKTFGQTVVDYSGKRMSGYIGKSEDKTVAGFGWG